MLRRRSALLFTVTLATLTPSSGAASGPAPDRIDDRASQWSAPVDGPIVRSFEPPERPFGPRHLGVDYAAGPGTSVRAASDVVVVFAGRTGPSWAVSVQHPGARRTTYAYLRRIRVTPGWPVRGGAVLGESGGTGPGHGAGVVHFGYRVNGREADPAALFQAPPPRISLAPLDRPACPRPSPTGVHLPGYGGG